MLRFRKIMSTSIAATMLITSMGFGAVAENPDEAVYTFINEYGNTEVITQAQLDAEHWNKNALGDVIPTTLQEFPMSIGSYVNEYSDLSLQIQYMKSVNSQNSATLTITELISQDTVYSEALTENICYIPVEVNTHYKLTITENTNAEQKQYVKMVTTSIAEAEMPEYITDKNSTSSNDILIGKISDLRASHYIDEDGEEAIDGTMQRYNKVSASDFSAVCANLESNNIYKIYTRDENEERYTGFISTYNDGIDYIYTPVIEVKNYDENALVQPTKLLAEITATDIQNATKRDVSYYKDYTFIISDSTNASSRFKVFEMTPVGTADGTPPEFTLDINTTCSFTIETWYDLGSTGNIQKYSSKLVTGTTLNRIFAMTTTEDLDENDKLYFVIYFQDNSYGRGDLSVQQTTFYEDDVTGSAYEAYNDENSVGEIAYQYYTITDWRDVDAFYINYTGTTSASHKIYMVNPILGEPDNTYPTRCNKTLEVARKTAGDGFDVSSSPDDIFDIPPTEDDGYITYRITISPSTPTFIYVYNTISGTPVNATTPYRLKWKPV